MRRAALLLSLVAALVIVGVGQMAATPTLQSWRHTSGGGYVVSGRVALFSSIGVPIPTGQLHLRYMPMISRQ